MLRFETEPLCYFMEPVSKTHMDLVTDQYTGKARRDFWIQQFNKLISIKRRRRKRRKRKRRRRRNNKNNE